MVFPILWLIPAFHATSIRWGGNFTSTMYFWVFLENLGLSKSKLSKRAKNKAKNIKNLKYSRRVLLWLFRAEMQNLKDTFLKFGILDSESPNTRTFMLIIIFFDLFNCIDSFNCFNHNIYFVYNFLINKNNSNQIALQNFFKDHVVYLQI